MVTPAFPKTDPPNAVGADPRIHKDSGHPALKEGAVEKATGSLPAPTEEDGMGAILRLGRALHPREAESAVEGLLGLSPPPYMTALSQKQNRQRVREPGRMPGFSFRIAKGGRILKLHHHDPRRRTRYDSWRTEGWDEDLEGPKRGRISKFSKSSQLSAEFTPQMGKGGGGFGPARKR